MSKLVKILSGVVLLGVMAVIYIWFFIYNKPHRDYEHADADYHLTAELCYNSYANGSQDAKQYLDKVLVLTGIPSSIETTDSTVIVVFAFGSGMFGDEGIRCSMLPNYHKQISTLDLSKMISIKGHCTGYNGTDVILDHCSLTTK